jgi:hypothetical protein
MDANMTLNYVIDNRSGLLAELHRRQAIVRDYVRGVARQYSTGLYLFGRPGTAKTHTVRAVLEQEIREIFTYQRGHITPMGLFELIASHPDEVIVLDDLGAILKSDVALQILLSALEHPNSRDRSRVVKYRRQGREERAVFRGGLVCISNRELHDDELLGAFKSRVHTLNYDPSDAQLGALMPWLAVRFNQPGNRTRRSAHGGPLPDRRDATALLPVRPAAARQQSLPRLPAMERRRGGIRLARPDYRVH